MSHPTRGQPGFRQHDHAGDTYVYRKPGARAPGFSWRKLAAAELVAITIIVVCAWSHIEPWIGGLLHSR